MADGDETQVPLVSNTNSEEQIGKDQLSLSTIDRNEINDDTVASSNDGDNEPLIKDNDKKTEEENNSNTNKNTTTTSSGTNKTEIQLENAIALSPRKDDEEKDNDDTQKQNEKNENKDENTENNNTEEKETTKENEKKEAQNTKNDNKDNDDDDDEPFISGIGNPKDSKDKDTEKEKEKDKENETKSNVVLTASNDKMDDDDDDDSKNDTPETKQRKELEKQVADLKQKISKIKANPPNFFEKYFQNTLTKLSNRQRRQREQQRERMKNTELNIKQQKLLRGHFGKVYCIDWTVDSEEIVSCSQDAKILIWNVDTTHKRVAIPLMTAWTMTCAWSTTSEMIACGGLDNTISIYRIKRDTAGWESKRPYIELLDHNGYISDIKFIDDRHLVSASGDASAMLYDIEKEYAIGQFKHKGDVMSISVHKNENLLLTGSTDGTAKIWDLRMAMDNGYNKKGGDTKSTNDPTNDNESKENGDGNDENGTSTGGGEIYSVASKHSFGSNNATNTSYSSDVNSVAWFPDASAFVMGCDDSHCKLFDLRTNCQLVSYYDPENTCNVTDIDISQSGKYVYATYDNDPWCVVWDTGTGDKKQTIVHPSRPACLRTAPNGYSFATGCWDNKIRIWCP